MVQHFRVSQEVFERRIRRCFEVSKVGDTIPLLLSCRSRPIQYRLAEDVYVQFLLNNSHRLSCMRISDSVIIEFVETYVKRCFERVTEHAENYEGVLTDYLLNLRLS